MIFFTSDLHFCHDKDFVWKDRGFDSVEEMNAAIVENWNKTVYPDDDVFILGDIVLNDTYEGVRLLKQLNGWKHIIRGNHDTDSKISLIQEECGINDISFAMEIKYKKALFWLSHYPTITANYDDELPWAKHLVNLFGHTHQKEKFYNNNPYMYNVGMDAHNCTPVSIDEIIEDIKKKKEELANASRCE